VAAQTFVSNDKAGNALQVTTNSVGVDIACHIWIREKGCGSGRDLTPLEALQLYLTLGSCLIDWGLISDVFAGNG
jgi:hypothetical protein